MFRKRRRPTSGFKIPPPFNAIQGENANLRQDGVSPFCAMMQIVAEDTYDNYVICRGFDPRILRFMENISVAKPFGKRTAGTYEIAEIYPAVLPTQGNANFMDFRNVTYMPPSPVEVNWRLGQNPGVVTGGLEGGQPDSLDDTIGILYDHNGKVVNWLLIDTTTATEAEGGSIEYTILSLSTAPSTSPYAGLIIASVTIHGTSCGLEHLIGEVVDVVDHSGCIFDLQNMTDYTGWADKKIYWSLKSNPPDPCETPTPCHWSAINRCCDPNTGTYAPPCPPATATSTSTSSATVSASGTKTATSSATASATSTATSTASA